MLTYTMPEIEDLDRLFDLMRKTLSGRAAPTGDGPR